MLRRKGKHVLPGFGLSLGVTVTYLSVIILIPLSTLLFKTFGLTWNQYVSLIMSPRVLASFRISFLASFAAAVINVIFGIPVAWALARYSFPGKRIIDALIDLPFALPTAVAGITLTTLYAETGWFGGILNSWGIKAAFTPLGIVIALTFIGIPFVVRTVQPVLEELEPDVEEAATSLGAGRWYTISRILFTAFRPALLVGFTLAFARALGEYGSVVFIAGNMPMHTEITTLLIITRLEQYDYPGATAIAITMLVVSFGLLLLVNSLHSRMQTRGTSP